MHGGGGFGGGGHGGGGCGGGHGGGGDGGGGDGGFGGGGLVGGGNSGSARAKPLPIWVWRFLLRLTDRKTVMQNQTHEDCNSDSHELTDS
jgi:hypothetical protein